MINSCSKIPFLSGTLLLGSAVVLLGSPAYGASLTQWKIDFYDYSDHLVGQGEFSYQSGQSTFISTCDNFECTGDEGFYVENFLESWTVNLVSRQWNAQDFPASLNRRWWDAQSLTVQGAFYSDRYSLFSGLDDAWVMRPVYNDVIGFAMTGMSGKGSSYWTEYYPISPREGYWVAEVVPEPLTFLGVVTAIGFGIVMKRQAKVKQ